MEKNYEISWQFFTRDTSLKFITDDFSLKFASGTFFLPEKKKNRVCKNIYHSLWKR